MGIRGFLSVIQTTLWTAFHDTQWLLLETYVLNMCFCVFVFCAFRTAYEKINSKIVISKSIYICLQVLHLMQPSQHPKSSGSEVILLSVIDK